MQFHHRRWAPFFWLILILQGFLFGCVQESAHYAPVTANNQAPVKSAGKPVRNNNGINRDKKADRRVAQDNKTEFKKHQPHHVVKNGTVLHLTGAGSGHGDEHLARQDRLSASDPALSGQRLKSFQEDKISYNNHRVAAEKKADKTPQEPPITENRRKSTAVKPAVSKSNPPAAVVKTVQKQEKKSIISTNNKKMLKLNFSWPIMGKIARNFNQSNNKGIDIAGKMGQKVRAAEAGKIAYSGQGLIGFGNLIIIKHNESYLSAYGNNSRLLVQEGEQVEKGQVIAQVGKALSKKAALHFEIRKNGKPVNPLNLLPRSDKTL